MELLFPIRTTRFWVGVSLLAVSFSCMYDRQRPQGAQIPPEYIDSIDAPVEAPEFHNYFVFPEIEVEYRADLPEIWLRDTLRALTIYSSTSYFLYKGQPMGYEYELVKRLAHHLDVELEMVVAEDINEIFEMLNNGEGDVIAYNLTVTKPRQEVVDFTLPLSTSRQVLVQKKPDKWKTMKLHDIEKQLIRNSLELIGKDIYVRENSSYRERLENLEEELGGEINIRYVPGTLTTAEIIGKVNTGEIPLTLADENIASINKVRYSNIDVSTPVSMMQQMAWSVRKSSPELLSALNAWIQDIRKEDDFYVIYNKYFENKRDFAERTRSDFFSMSGDKISVYDDIIRRYAKQINWDWRFLASLIYQESLFDPKRESWAGAVGLMQLMPATARSYGITNLKNPTQNIRAGTSHLAYLEKYWKRYIKDPEERVKFVLASYNAGHNHVQDARRLAAKYGYDDRIWYNNVEQCMLMKSSKQYYNDRKVVFYGYCRGEETVEYVKAIIERYTHYMEFIGEKSPYAAG